MAYDAADSRTIPASTTSSNVDFGPALGVGSWNLRVFNGSTAVAFVKWGKGPQTATVNDVACQPGWTHIFDMGDADNVAAILLSGTGNVYVNRDVAAYQLPPSAVFDVDVTQPLSYSGAGQFIMNMVASPKDGLGSGSSAYNVQFGFNSSSSTDDPTFVGPVGSQYAYLYLDGNDILSIPSNTTWLANLHQSGNPFWMAIAFQVQDNAGSVTTMGTTNSSGGTGIRLFQSSTKNIQIAQRGDTAQVTTSSMGITKPGSDMLIIASGDGAGNLRFWINSRVKQSTSIVYNAATTAAFVNLRILSGYAAGTLFYAAAMGSSYIDDSEAVRIIDLYNQRHGRVYA